MATYTPRTYAPSSTVDFIHGLPHIGSIKEFTASTEGDAMNQYWVMSVGVLAGAVSLLLIACGILMWIFTCCFCCKCCQRKCYCARCCCCTRHNKKFYGGLLTMAVVSLAFGQLARSSVQDMLNNATAAFNGCATLLDAIGGKITEYGSHFSTMSSAIDTGGNCDSTITTNLKNLLQTISDKMALVKLPVGSKIVDPMVKALKTSDTFPPDMDKLQDGEGLLQFGFDSGLGLIGGLIIMLAFFACFANYRSKCSDGGCGRSIKCCYIFLVLVFGSLILFLNVVIGAGLMGMSVAVADMCHKGPDTVFGDLFTTGGILEKAEGISDILYWTTCTGNNPLMAALDAIEIPLDSLSNANRGGTWDQVTGGCKTATATIGEHCAVLGGAKVNGMGVPGCSAADGSMLALGSTDAAKHCISRQTIADFRDLFGCPANQYTTAKQEQTPLGGLNYVYNKFVYDALCTDLVGTFFYLWAAISLSSFFILFAFFVLPCTSRDGGTSRAKEKAAREADADGNPNSNMKV